MISYTRNNYIEHVIIHGQFATMEGQSMSGGPTHKKQIQYLDELLDQKVRKMCIGEGGS